MLDFFQFQGVKPLDTYDIQKLGCRLAQVQHSGTSFGSLTEGYHANSLENTTSNEQGPF